MPNEDGGLTCTLSVRLTPLQYSLESAARSRSWFVLQLKALHAEADALRQKIPDELRWDPATTDDRLFHQTTAVGG